MSQLSDSFYNHSGYSSNCSMEFCFILFFVYSNHVIATKNEADVIETVLFEW